MPRTAERADASAPWGLAGALVLVVAAELGFDARADRYCGWLAYTWRDSARAARGPEVRDAEILGIGDSLLKQGVVPKILEDRLGRPCYNLAAHGASAPTTYFLFRNALRAGARPRAVVLDVHPNILAVQPKSSGVGWAEVAGPLDVLDMAVTTADLGLVLNAMGSNVLPSVRLRFGVREAVLGDLRGGEPAGRLNLRAIGRNVRVNRGAWVAPVVPPLENPERLLWNLPDFGPWRPHPSNVAYLRKLLALATRERITVVWLLPPTSPAWQSRRESLGADRRYCDFVKTMQAEFPGIVVVDGRHAGYPQPAFFDLTHLHARGATELTLALAGLLGPILDVPPGRSAWVELPPYRGREADPALEDLDRSKLAVGGAGAMRK